MSPKILSKRFSPSFKEGDGAERFRIWLYTSPEFRSLTIHFLWDTRR